MQRSLIANILHALLIAAAISLSGCIGGGASSASDSPTNSNDVPTQDTPSENGNNETGNESPAATVITTVRGKA